MARRGNPQPDPNGAPRISTVAKGQRAEELALRYLQRRGLRLIARNYRCRVGEIDLVMMKSGVVVFVEVRSRASPAFLNPKQTVDWRKQQRLARVAAWFLRSHRNFAGLPVRFDVVSVIAPNSRATLEWIQHAFQTDDFR